MTTVGRTDSSGATKILDVVDVVNVVEEFPANGTYVGVDVYLVEPSDRYTEGVKYTMQYGTVAGETIIRYDNFPDHPNTTIHHKHVGETTVEAIKFGGVRQLFERFKSEVRAHGEQWP